MPQRKADERGPGSRVGVGRALAGEVGLEQQALDARRPSLGLPKELLVGRAAGRTREASEARPQR